MLLWIAPPTFAKDPCLSDQVAQDWPRFYQEAFSSAERIPIQMEFKVPFQLSDRLSVGEADKLIRNHVFSLLNPIFDKLKAHNMMLNTLDLEANKRFKELTATANGGIPYKHTILRDYRQGLQTLVIYDCELTEAAIAFLMHFTNHFEFKTPLKHEGFAPHKYAWPAGYEYSGRPFREVIPYYYPYRFQSGFVKTEVRRAFSDAMGWKTSFPIRYDADADEWVIHKPFRVRHVLTVEEVRVLMGVASGYFGRIME